MAEMNRINSFKSFTEVRNAETANRLREENQTKRRELAQKFESILDEMGITSYDELDEETQNNLISKILGKELNERNAFLGARAKAIAEDREEFEFNGKSYKVTTKSDVSEGNAFGDAVRKAKEAGDKEFEFEGKTYKVTEDHSDNPNDKYEVKPCEEEGTPWSVWEGDVQVKCFETKEEAEGYAQKQNQEQGLEEGNAFGDAVRKAKEAGDKEFEFEGKTYKVTESITEAIKVEGKRDAKKVVTVYNKIFNKVLVDLGAMSNESILGCVKYLMIEAMHDANFHREAEPTGKMIKGNIQPLEIKMPGLGGHFIKIGPKTIKSILDKYYSDIANAAGWGGQGIVEGTALYLEQIKQEAMGQAAITKFNSQFEGEQVRVDINAKINEAKVLEAAAWEIGKDYPSYGVVVSVVHNDDTCEVLFDSGDKIVFRDTGSSWVQEATVTEGAVKRFEMDVKDMIKNIKRGYGWIDPEFVEDTWENTSDTINFELVKAEIYKRLIAAGLLAHSNDDNEEEAGEYVNNLKELGIKESVVTEGKEADEAESILNDLLDERGGDFDELRGMEMEDALDTVEAYGHKGSKAKKIAQELVSMCNESVVTEAKFVKDFNRDVLNAKTKEEVLKLYPNAEFFIGKSDHFFGELDDNLFFKAYYTKAQEEFEIKSVYSEKGSNYVHLYNESVVNEGKFNKSKLLKALGKNHDGEILVNGKTYIIYNPDSGNDDNAAMWNDKTIFAVDQDGEDHEIKYSDIVSYNEAEIKSDEEFQEYAFTVLKKAFGDDFDEEKGQEIVDGILSKSDGDYGAAVGMLTSSLG